MAAAPVHYFLDELDADDIIQVVHSSLSCTWQTACVINMMAIASCSLVIEASECMRDKIIGSAAKYS